MILEIIIGLFLFDGILAFLFWLLTANDFKDDRTAVATLDAVTAD